MAMRKSSRISAKKSLESASDLISSDVPSSNSASTNGINTPETSSTLTSLPNSSNVDTCDQENIHNNGVTSNCSNGGNIVIDLPLLEEVTEKAIIITKEIPPETEPVPAFETIENNIYLCEMTRECKDVRRLTCDCSLTKEEKAKGKMGCGEECLNRIMMIECTSRCPLGDNCSNRRFQRRQYCKIEPFRAGLKGWGIRAMQNIDAGVFIMEYVGEVVDPEEFMKRVERYDKKGIIHHYFMSLKNDIFIDATNRGNVTRFTNHSCEPNCEIQKWTIHGDLRIGLFSSRSIEMGEELSIDYKIQRYGEKAQKCYCEAPSCLGYIGSNEASDIYIDGSKKSKNPDLEINDEDNDEGIDEMKDPKDSFRIPRLVGPKRNSDSSEDRSINNNSHSSNYSKRNHHELFTPASLLRNKKFKNDQQQQQQMQQQQLQQDPNQVEQVKFSKEAFRMQFELQELKRQREEEKALYLAQIAHMKREIEMTKGGGYPDQPQSSYFYNQNYLNDVYSYPIDGQNCLTTLPPSHPSFSSSHHSNRFSPNSFTDQSADINFCTDYEQQQQQLLQQQQQQASSLPILTNYAPNVIEVTSKEHTLMSDDKAVIQTDYGVEYTPKAKSLYKQHAQRNNLFDPAFPPPGIYYEHVDPTCAYYAPHPFDSQNNPMEFYATTVATSLPDFTFLLDNVEGPLPRNWRRACDPKSNRIYYYNKKNGSVSWHLPQGSGIKQKYTHSTGTIGLAAKIESIIASADSTSTPPPSLYNSSHLSNASQSPPGIFAISNGIDKDSKKSQLAEPDQSLPKKTKQTFFDVRTKKGRDRFKEEITEMVKKFLYPYLKPDCKVGRIESNDDFKTIARKLTQEVYSKETNSGKVELTINQSVKLKAHRYVSKYMQSKGPVFKMSKSHASHNELKDLDDLAEGQTVVNGTSTAEINDEETNVAAAGDSIQDTIVDCDASQ